MCGRYATSRTKVQLTEAFHVASDQADEVPRADFNVSPTKRVPIVLTSSAPDSEAEAAVRQLRLATWGITPVWMAKAGKKGRPLTNARAETIDEKPTFRRPFEQRRCLVPADGFYEWFAEAGGKQPYFFRPVDGAVLAMAGIVEWWHDPENKTLWFPTFSVITTKATDDAGKVHDRMPMTVQPDRWDAWLDPGLTDAAKVRRLMAAPAKGSLDIFPVSKAVNVSKNNGPGLVEPAEIGS
ncbi:SOS response-associated peptidase [Hamadaea tsunoensis]|uniref:SOS response-associated peptidase n=1 Tax=Hamadaea tsunoensis TaxID=53368 RepID=UPI000481D7FE|nr:SOS response-associated peptidase [Hamadaea tsunoensis]